MLDLPPHDDMPYNYHHHNCHRLHHHQDDDDDDHYHSIVSLTTTTTTTTTTTIAIPFRPSFLPSITFFLPHLRRSRPSFLAVLRSGFLVTMADFHKQRAFLTSLPSFRPSFPLCSS
jgi:hypothetical protein